MQSRVYALRPYTTVIGHYSRENDESSLYKYEVSILYSPYFRGYYYRIVDVQVLDGKDGNCYAICTMAASDCCDGPEVLSETVFVPVVKGTKHIDTYFFFKIPESRSALEDINFKDNSCTKHEDGQKYKKKFHKRSLTDNDGIDDLIGQLKEEGYECNSTSNNDSDEPPSGRIP